MNLQRNTGARLGNTRQAGREMAAKVTGEYPRGVLGKGIREEGAVTIAPQGPFSSRSDMVRPVAWEARPQRYV